MKTIKGPGIFLAQFLGAEPPFDTLDHVCAWAASLGYIGVQIPTNLPHIFDLDKAASSKTYCEEITGLVASHGLKITELSTHLQGQLVAVHPAYDKLFENFAPPYVRGNAKETQAWATAQLKNAAIASKYLGLNAHATFSGALLWPTVYPWPQRPAGLVELGFKELASRWKPILDVFDENGIDACYELHPGEDLHDGVTFERFLEAVGDHKRACILYDPSHFVLQQLDYLQFIEFYHSRIKAFHVKDAEFLPSGKSGVYGGYSDWANRPGRFRSLGDGQVNFKSIFTRLSKYNYTGWAVLEWECFIKSAEQGAAEGAPFITDQIIQVTAKAFDDFASAAGNNDFNHKILGLS